MDNENLVGNFGRSVIQNTKLWFRNKFFNAFGITSLNNKETEEMLHKDRIGSCFGISHRKIVNIFRKNMYTLEEIQPEYFKIEDGKLHFNGSGNRISSINLKKPDVNEMMDLITGTGFNLGVKEVSAEELKNHLIAGRKKGLIDAETTEIDFMLEEYGNPLGVSLDKAKDGKVMVIVLPDLFYELDDAILCACVCCVGATYIDTMKSENLDGKLIDPIAGVPVFNLVDMVDHLYQKPIRVVGDEEFEKQMIPRHVIDYFGDMTKTQFKEMMSMITSEHEVGES